MTSAHSLAHAKINLFLHITARREDGYHTLDSLAVFASAADRLGLALNGGAPGAVSLRIAGQFGEGLEPDANNLVLRATNALRAVAPDPTKLPSLDLGLDKELPIASGIGGGSADAAAALRLVSEAWNLGEVDLVKIAAQLGADVPVCIAQRPARMSGIGEILEPVPDLPSFSMVLVNPGVAVPTPRVFHAWKESGAAFRSPVDIPALWNGFDDFIANLHETANDLQAPAIELYPVIATVLQALHAQPGCAFARMSGSGATCFGIFASNSAAQVAARALGAHGWWTNAGPVI